MFNPCCELGGKLNKVAVITLKAVDLECRRVGGGQTTLQTMSNRHIVKTYKYFKTEDWEYVESKSKNKAWRVARSSEQAKNIRSMQYDFLDKVKVSEALANQEKFFKMLRKSFWRSTKYIGVQLVLMICTS